MYKIKLTYLDGSTDEIEITTDDLEWSMNQYQRNREPFTWEVLDQNTMIKCTPISNDKFNHIIYKTAKSYMFHRFENLPINEYTPPESCLLSWDYLNDEETITHIISKEFLMYNSWYELDLELNEGLIQSKIQLSDLSSLLDINGNWIDVVDIKIGTKLSCFPNRHISRYKTIRKITKFNSEEEFLNLNTKSGEYLCNGVWVKCLDNGKEQI